MATWMSWRDLLAEGLHRLPARVHTLVPSAQRDDLRHWLGRYLPWEEGADLTPPPLDRGESIGPPDFVGIGATMSGCRRWYGMIADHPEIWDRPDLTSGRHFLSHFATGPFGAAEIEQFHGWFPRRRGTITGEWTPGYAALPWVAGLLVRAAPAAKLLMLVRNPIERIRLDLARRPMERGSQVGTLVADAMERGLYGAQLRRILDFFPADQVLVLQYEHCAADPIAQLSLTYRFLGVDDSYRPTGLRTPPSARWASTRPLDPGVAARLVALYSDDVAQLASAVPTFDPSWWPEFARS